MDNIVVVGGLLPSLLILKESLSETADAHIVTMDLDLGLALSLLNAHRFEDLTLRIRRAGFKLDINEAGNPTFQCWKIESSSDLKITIDSVIAFKA